MECIEKEIDLWVETKREEKAMNHNQKTTITKFKRSSTIEKHSVTFSLLTEKKRRRSESPKKKKKKDDNKNEIIQNSPLHTEKY